MMGAGVVTGGKNIPIAKTLPYHTACGLEEGEGAELERRRKAAEKRARSMVNVG